MPSPSIRGMFDPEPYTNDQSQCDRPTVNLNCDIREATARMRDAGWQDETIGPLTNDIRTTPMFRMGCYRIKLTGLIST
jgi:hypothetical protein